MIEMGKTYRTKSGHAVRLYATDGSAHYPIHGAIRDSAGWSHAVWSKDGQFCVNTQAPLDRDLIESDPHGILPRHRELLAEVMAEHKHDFCENVEIVRTGTFASLVPAQQVALIALAKLDAERGR